VRFQILSACLAALVLIAGCKTPTPYTYGGRVVDRHGRPVTEGAVIGWAFGPTRDEFMSIGGDIASDGTFELPSTKKLDEITASRDGKHLVTLKHPQLTGNVIVLR
jgi:uncharacterized membrane protein